MRIQLASNRVILTNSIPQDIPAIIDIEQSNQKFIHSYSHEKHMQLLEDKNCLHLSGWHYHIQGVVNHSCLLHARCCFGKHFYLVLHLADNQDEPHCYMHYQKHYLQ